jgi:hypothetical protein
LKYNPEDHNLNMLSHGSAIGSTQRAIDLGITKNLNLRTCDKAEKSEFNGESNENTCCGNHSYHALCSSRAACDKISKDSSCVYHTQKKNCIRAAISAHCRFSNISSSNEPFERTLLELTPRASSFEGLQISPVIDGDATPPVYPYYYCPPNTLNFHDDAEESLVMDTTSESSISAHIPDLQRPCLRSGEKFNTCEPSQVDGSQELPNEPNAECDAQGVRMHGSRCDFKWHSSSFEKNDACSAPVNGLSRSNTYGINSIIRRGVSLVDSVRCYKSEDEILSGTKEVINQGEDCENMAQLEFDRGDVTLTPKPFKVERNDLIPHDCHLFSTMPFAPDNALSDEEIDLNISGNDEFLNSNALADISYQDKRNFRRARSSIMFGNVELRSVQFGSNTNGHFPTTNMKTEPYIANKSLESVKEMSMNEQNWSIHTSSNFAFEDNGAMPESPCDSTYSTFQEPQRQRGFPSRSLAQLDVLMSEANKSAAELSRALRSQGQDPENKGRITNILSPTSEN